MAIKINLYQDWLDTVKHVFHGAGAPLPSTLSDKGIGVAYYNQTSSSEEEAEQRRQVNEQRITELQQTLLDNMTEIIIPDIRNKTGYTGDAFHFRWVYAQGEHIIEENSQYRIPLGPSPEA
ncbi:hypothetical protein EBB07_02145 [Paenibacillaceae bacterium]|nr:hypothetical protein EBB07_02145 [Paenibacillaceae bacterium]